MSLEVVKRWGCDVCNLTAEVERPKGWVWYRGSDGKLCHRCGTCEKNRPEGVDKGVLLGVLSSTS